MYTPLTEACETRAAASGASVASDACVSPAEGSGLDNMDPSISQGGDGGGFDTVHATGYGEWSPEAWSSMRTLLSDARERAMEVGEAVSVWPELAAEPISVEPRGAGRGFAHTPWVCKVGGLTYRFCDRESSEDDSRPVVFVEIGSVALMADGLRAVLDRVFRQLGTAGLSVHRLSPSRADLCVDLGGVDMEEFAEAYHSGCVVTCARADGGEVGSDSRWRGRAGRVETLMFGRRGGAIALRIYDKLAECRDDEVKRHLLQEERWGGVIPRAATRVEFELRRESLRDRFDVDSCYDLIEKSGGIVRYLTREWFRICSKKSVGNVNRERAEASPMWRRVQAAFEGWATGLRPPCRRRVVSLEWRRLVSTAMGALEGAYVRKHLRTATDAEAFAVELHAMLTEGRDYAALGERVARKFLELLDGVRDGLDDSWTRVVDRIQCLRASLPETVVGPVTVGVEADRG